MKKKEMRLQFNDDTLKEKLMDMAAVCGLSLNSLVNLMISYHVDPINKKSFSLLMDLYEFKKSSEMIY